MKCLLQKHANLNLDPQHPCQKASKGVPACGSVWEAETRAPRSLLASQARQLVNSRFGGRSCANTNVEID